MHSVFRDHLEKKKKAKQKCCQISQNCLAKSSGVLPEKSDDDMAVEDKRSENKVLLAEALNCAETSLDFLEQGSNCL